MYASIQNELYNRGMSTLTQKTTILLVEDEEAIAKPLARLLRMANHEVHWEIGAQQGLDWLVKNPDVSLILVDIMMPEMNGWEFREEQSKLGPPLSNIPAIFLSADSQSAKKGKELGEHFISKPIDLKYLKEMIIKLTTNAADVELNKQ